LDKQNESESKLKKEPQSEKVGKPLYEIVPVLLGLVL
jgi:hypothetical protein